MIDKIVIGLGYAAIVFLLAQVNAYLAYALLVYLAVIGYSVLRTLAIQKKREETAQKQLEGLSAQIMSMEDLEKVLKEADVKDKPSDKDDNDKGTIQ